MRKKLRRPSSESVRYASATAAASARCVIVSCRRSRSATTSRTRATSRSGSPGATSSATRPGVRRRPRRRDAIEEPTLRHRVRLSRRARVTVSRVAARAQQRAGPGVGELAVVDDLGAVHDARGRCRRRRRTGAARRSGRSNRIRTGCGADRLGVDDDDVGVPALCEAAAFLQAVQPRGHVGEEVDRLFDRHELALAHRLHRAARSSS